MERQAYTDTGPPKQRTNGRACSATKKHGACKDSWLTQCLMLLQEPTLTAHQSERTTYSKPGRSGCDPGALTVPPEASNQ